VTVQRQGSGQENDKIDKSKREDTQATYRQKKKNASPALTVLYDRKPQFGLHPHLLVFRHPGDQAVRSTQLDDADGETLNFVVVKIDKHAAYASGRYRCRT
jgi:hypothetical protein